MFKESNIFYQLYGYFLLVLTFFIKRTINLKITRKIQYNPNFQTKIIHLRVFKVSEDLANHVDCLPNKAEK